jgi:nickel/cobalt transporter (NicO) family protein
MRFARRLGATVLLSVAAFGTLALVAAPAALAHPLGNFTINHYAGLALTPGHVRVTYALDMAEIPTFQQKSAIDANGDGVISDAERAAWARAETPTIAPHLVLSVDGRRVTLTSDCPSSMVFRPGQGGLPILRMVSVFDAGVPASGAIAFRDTSFADRIGWKEITAAGTSGVSMKSSSVPATSISNELLRYPTNLLQSPLSVTRASLTYSASGPAPEPACPGVATATPKAAGSSFAALITWKLTPLILVGSLLLAFGFGVVHAIGPGHGKTITAAYLVGSGAKARQAIGVGVAVASMHTLSVLGLGVLAVVLSASFPAERIYPWLTVVTGAVALVLGAALLMLRVRALRRGADRHGHTHPWDETGDHGHADHEHADHEHADHEHAHDGGHHHDHGRELALVGAPGASSLSAARAAVLPASAYPGVDDGVERYHPVPDHVHTDASGHRANAARGSVSRPKLAALAVSGGLLPSPTALVVLLAAISAHRVAYGLSLIVAFSAGLASALIAIAMLALRARGLVDRKLGTRAARVLPILSALVIVGFGVFFLTKGVLQVGV